MEISNIPVLVTGGAKRIGAAVVRSLGERGAWVVIHYGQSSREARELAEEVRICGGRAETIQGDLANPEEVESLISRAGQFFGPLRILINNASVFQPGNMVDTPLARWQGELNVNLTTPFLLMQGFSRQLPQGVQGRIINLIDQRIARPRPGHLAYTVAKSALWTLTQIAAQELAPMVQVNAIGPGPILPATQDGPEGFKAVSLRTPLGRSGSPEDIVKALLFLIDQEYITGEMIRVDGGEHLI